VSGQSGPGAPGLLFEARGTVGSYLGMLTWEFNFNLGTILPIVFSAGVFYAITKADMRVLKDNVVDIKAQLKIQTETIAQIAVQKERLDNQGRRIDDALEEIRAMRSSRDYLRRIEGEWPKSS
jgi:hypothetical protein